MSPPKLSRSIFCSFNFTWNCNSKMKRLQYSVLRIFFFSLRIEPITKIISTSRTGRILVRSSYWRCSIKKAVLENFAIFTGKHLSWSVFFNKVAGLQTCNFIKKRLERRCFPKNVAKFLRTSILK